MTSLTARDLCIIFDPLEHAWELQIHLTRMAEDASSNIGRSRPLQFPLVMPIYEAMRAENLGKEPKQIGISTATLFRSTSPSGDKCQQEEPRSGRLHDGLGARFVRAKAAIKLDQTFNNLGVTLSDCALEMLPILTRLAKYSRVLYLAPGRIFDHVFCELIVAHQIKIITTGGCRSYTMLHNVTGFEATDSQN